MPDQTIICPKCGAEIPLNEALTGQIEQVIKAKYEADAAAKEKDLQAKLQQIDKQSKELQAKEQSIAQQVAEQLKTERKTIAEQEKVKALAEQAEQTKALQEELAEKRNQLSEANKKELELRKQQQKLEEEKAQIELTVQRQIDQERKKIAETATAKAAEEQQLKMREKDDQLEAMKKKIDELKRKAEVGSQERQGEALEGTLQDVLQQAFPYDKFEEIKKGQRGADIMQIVRNNMAKQCGKILWESKNTKDFSNTWIDKIKADQQGSGADMAVIMSIALPKAIDHFGPYEGIWVTDYKSAVGICAAFRDSLIRVERQRLVTEHQDGMKDIVYKYITGQEFAMRVKRIADAYIGMQSDLESEKRSMSKIWSKREKQISLVLDNLTSMSGEIEGVIGGQKLLPSMDTFSLDAIAIADDQK